MIDGCIGIIATIGFLGSILLVVVVIQTSAKIRDEEKERK